MMKTQIKIQNQKIIVFIDIVAQLTFRSKRNQHQRKSDVQFHRSKFEK